MSPQSQTKETSETLSEDLQAEIAALRKDLSALAQTVGRIGSTGLAEARDAAKERLARSADLGAGLGAELREELRKDWAAAEQRLATETRARPLQALGLAALAGFALAILLRR